MQQDQQRINKSILDYSFKDLLDIPNADKKYQITLLLVYQYLKNYQRKQYQLDELAELNDKTSNDEFYDLCCWLYEI